MRLLLISVLVACGGSGSHVKAPEQPEKPEAKDPYWEWHESRPKSPEQPIRTTKFQPPQQCGQGPYRFSVDGVAAPFSESVVVVACAPKAFRGSVSYRAPGYGKSETGFGKDTDAHHEKCRVDATVVTSAGSSSSGGGTAKPAARGKASGAASKTAPTTVELTGVVVATDTKCPAGTSDTPIINHGYSVGDEPRAGTRPPLRGAFVIELWSELPNDLTGVSFLVRQRGVPADYKLEDWIAYRRAYKEWSKGRDEMLAQSRALGHKWTTVELPAATKQPPPARPERQPPKPSANASWIPGYWQFTDGWIWSAGFWRVPPKDIEQERTVEAPKPPPAPRVEAAPDAAFHMARKAIWTPGHWMWNGAGYVWIAGSWRIPEAAGTRWIAPTWRPTRRGTVIYIPGGFVLRGRRR